MTQDSSVSRRDVLKTSAITGGLLAAHSMTTQSTQAAQNQKAKVKKNGVILFQGDSITDAGRNRKRKEANLGQAFGRGYPFLISSQLQSRYPKKQLKCFNRGISGNKVPDLDKRWQEDCIDLNPSVLSILIGVNDIWHKLNGKYDGTVQQYEEGLDALLKRTKKALPDVTLVVCEPFVLRCGAVNDKWFPEFDERRAACKRTAEKTPGVIWVPFQEAFDKATKQAPPEYWAADGVHPSMAGHSLMARTWIREVFPWQNAKKKSGKSNA